jgi:heterodisulfide reductase subunit A-like polyferredoxin
MQQLWTPSKVTEEASKMQGVVFAYNHKYMCSDPDRIPSNRPLRNIAWSKS